VNQFPDPPNPRHGTRGTSGPGSAPSASSRPPAVAPRISETCLTPGAPSPPGGRRGKGCDRPGGPGRWSAGRPCWGRCPAPPPGGQALAHAAPDDGSRAAGGLRASRLSRAWPAGNGLRPGKPGAPGLSGRRSPSFMAMSGRNVIPSMQELSSLSRNAGGLACSRPRTEPPWLESGDGNGRFPEAQARPPQRGWSFVAR
jgi:hypothetical protein